MIIHHHAAYVMAYLSIIDSHRITNQHRQHLNAAGRRLNQAKITAGALPSSDVSPFQIWFEKGTDQDFRCMTGLDRQAFLDILALFEPLFDAYHINRKTGAIELVELTIHGKKKGRPREISAAGCLCLVLLWYRTTGALSRTHQFFLGSSRTPLSDWLRFGKRVLLSVLQAHPDAMIMPPTDEEIDQYCAAVVAKFPHAVDIWGAADGVKLSIQGSGDINEQNMFYNGWYHGTFHNSIFVFAPDGRIRLCCFNSPGCWHDSWQADMGNVYHKLEDIYLRTGKKVVIDSAFKLHNAPFLIKSAQTDPYGAGPLLQNRAATSVRQLSEWGMRMIEAQFPRLGKEALRYETTGERKCTINLMILLYNFATKRVGINQILNTYMPEQSGEFKYYYDGPMIPPTADHLFE